MTINWVVAQLVFNRFTPLHLSSITFITRVLTNYDVFNLCLCPTTLMEGLFRALGVHSILLDWILYGNKNKMTTGGVIMSMVVGINQSAIISRIWSKNYTAAIDSQLTKHCCHYIVVWCHHCWNPTSMGKIEIIIIKWNWTRIK